MSTSGEKIHVLHVDDEPDFADMTAGFLEREDNGISTQTATSAEEGLEKLADSDIDCVVSDYDMPDIDGIEFLETVRERYDDLPFILYTGKGSEEVASEAISAGVTDYLQKGTGGDQNSLLANRIQNAVGHVRANQRASREHRINSVVRKVNDALVRATTHEEIDEQVCKIISEAEPYRLAWIGEHRPETSVVEPRSAAGTGDGYLNDIQITTDDRPTAQGPTAQAVLGRKLSVVQNIPEKATYAPWREHALEHDFKSSAAVPLEYDDRLYGVLNVYADRTDAFDEPERRLLSNLAETIAHAYHRIDLQREYADQYRTLFEEAPVMVVFSKATGEGPVIEDCNPAFAERLGYTREELRETRLAKYYTESSTEKLLREDGYQRALNGEFTKEQRTLRTRDGEEVLTMLRAAPRRDMDGEIIGTHALYLDITNQRQIQELERMTALFEQAQEIADLGAWETDLRNDVGWWTEGVNRIYGLPVGYEPDPGEGIEYFHPEDRPKIRDAFQRAKETGESYDLELRVVGESGELKWVRARGEAQVDNGEIVSVRGTLQDITDRKEREQELRRYASLFEHANDAIALVDYCDGTPIIREANPAFKSIFAPEEDLVGQDLDTIVASGERVEDARNMTRRVREEGVVREEITRDTVKGPRDFFWQRIPVMDSETEEVESVFAIYTDITERTEQSRRLETLISNLPGIVYRARNEAGWPMDIVRGETEKLTGYSAKEIQRGEVSWGADIIHPAERERVWEAVQNAREEERPFEMTYRVQTKTGETKWVWERGRFIESKYQQGEILEGFITDITERKERKRELERLKNRYESFLQCSNDIITVLDENGTIEYESPAVERILGYDSGSRVGEVAFEYVHPDDRSDVLDQFMEVVNGDTDVTERIEYRTKHADGSWIWIESISNARTQTEVGAYVVNSREITERKQRERELERQNERLDEFTKVVSHDLRNPLNVAEGRLALAREECDSDHLEQIEEGLDRMNILIRDLLKLARTGKDVTNLEPVEMAPLIEDCWAHVETGEATITIDIERTVQADRTLLTQMFENLIRNAVEHGGRDVTVTIGDMNGGFYLEDDGPGIPEGERDRVFEPGYSTSDGGTGLGLNIVKKIVQAHDWEIQITEGRIGGARFEIVPAE